MPFLLPTNSKECNLVCSEKLLYPIGHEWFDPLESGSWLRTETRLLLQLCHSRSTDLVFLFTFHLVFLFTPGPDGWNNYWSHGLYFVVRRGPAGSCRLAGLRKKHTVTHWNLINCWTLVNLIGKWLETKLKHRTDAKTWWDTTVSKDNKQLKKDPYKCIHTQQDMGTHIVRK